MTLAGPLFGQTVRAGRYRRFCLSHYLGYIEVNLQIPGMKGYNEDILLLVIPTTTYLGESHGHSQVQIHRLGDGSDDQGGTCMRVTADLDGSMLTLVHLGLGHSSCPHTDSKGDKRSGEGDNPLPKL